ncbi:MAG: hypothetical protein ACREEP_05840, partial [Dongiaceae bacterium]
PNETQAFALTYFPWFRFLSEPVAFDAVDRVAEYVACCFQFLLARNGFPAVIERDGDRRHVLTEAGVAIEAVGMQALKSIVLSHDAKRTAIDIEAKQIQVDRSMFPSVYQAGREMLETPDRLLNVDVRKSETHLILTEAKGAEHV